MLLFSRYEVAILLGIPLFIFGMIGSPKYLHLSRLNRIYSASKDAFLYCSISLVPLLALTIFARVFTPKDLIGFYTTILLICGLPYILGNLIRRQKSPQAGPSPECPATTDSDAKGS